MSRKARIKNDEVDRIRQMKAEHGLTVTEIMERTGRSMSSVYKALKPKQEKELVNESS